MVRSYNYYGVKDNFVWHLSSCTRFDTRPGYNPKIFNESEKIWYQGPRGGVRMIKENGIYQYKYITCDEQLIKDFFWIKVQAKNLNI